MPRLKAPAHRRTVTKTTALFLVLLRLAIGWHLLFEGLEKYRSGTFSSEAYLRESTGPLSPFFRRLAGDSVSERFTMNSASGGDRPAARIPTRLAEEWQAYFDRFVARHQFDEEQRASAREKFDKFLDDAVTWFDAPKPYQKTGPDGSAAEVPMTPQARFKEYQQLQQEMEALQSSVVNSVGWRGYYDQAKPLRTKANAIRAELQGDIAERSKALQKVLAEVLRPDQKPGLAVELKRPMRNWGRQEWVDSSVTWGLIVIGGALILGLLTRPACLAAAVMLLSFYLAMPPWPMLPDNPKAEGHYFFVNKNLIEMLALFALATVPSGRWVGLDGLLYGLRSRRKVNPAR